MSSCSDPVPTIEPFESSPCRLRKPLSIQLELIFYYWIVPSPTVAVMSSKGWPSPQICGFDMPGIVSLKINNFFNCSDFTIKQKKKLSFFSLNSLSDSLAFFLFVCGTDDSFFFVWLSIYYALLSSYRKIPFPSKPDSTRVTWSSHSKLSKVVCAGLI